MNVISEDSVKNLVDTFYRKVRTDEQLGPIFNRAISDWGPHLATMYRFWSSVMLSSGQYKGNPVAAHVRLDGMQPHLFERWLKLFSESCDELFGQAEADAFREKAARIAESLKLALFYRPDRPWPLAAS